MDNRPIIIFDGVCNFCNGSVNFIIKRDAAAVFAFTPAQSETAKALMEQHHIPNLANDTFILIKNGTCFTRTNAALEITKDLSGFWFLFRIFKLLPTSFRDIFYDALAKNRYKLFGKKDSCMVPSQNIKDRFI